MQTKAHRLPVFTNKVLLEWASLGAQPAICLQAGDPGSIPGLERSPGEGIGYPLLYSVLKNSMGCIVHGIAKSRTQLSEFHFHFIGTQLHPFVSINKLPSKDNSRAVAETTWRTDSLVCGPSSRNVSQLLS